VGKSDLFFSSAHKKRSARCDGDDRAVFLGRGGGGGVERKGNKLGSLGKGDGQGKL